MSKDRTAIMTFFSSITAFDVLVEAIGVLGIIASVISFQCKKHNRLLLFRSANESLFALQYGLLGAYTGMAMNIIGVARNIVFTKLVEKNKSTIPARVAFSAAFVIFIAVTWSGFKSLLSGTAKVISTFAYGSTNFALTRVLIFITSTSWFVYNLLVKSYAGCACELLTLGSIVVSLVRYGMNKKKAAAGIAPADGDRTEQSGDAPATETAAAETAATETATEIGSENAAALDETEQNVTNALDEQDIPQAEQTDGAAIVADEAEKETNKSRIQKEDR